MTATEDDLLAAIMAALPPRYIPGVHYSAEDIAKIHNVTQRSGLDILARLARNPAFVREKVLLENGRVCWAIRKKKPAD